MMKADWFCFEGGSGEAALRKEAKRPSRERGGAMSSRSFRNGWLCYTSRVSNTELRPRGVLLYVTIAVFFLVAICSFVFEDFLHPVGPANDLSVPWVATRTFAEGKNPYNDYAEFERIWAATGIHGAHGCPDYRCILAYYTSGYPPTALALLTPLGALSIQAAVRAVMYLSVAALVIVLLLAAAQMGYGWGDPRTLYFIGFVLAMAPLHGGIHNSNLNTAIFALLLAGAVLLRRQQYWAGVALALAFCIKPQVAILFCAYPLLRKMWKVVAAEVATVLAVSVASLGWMGLHHVAWYGAYRESMARFSSPNGPSSFTSSVPSTFHMIHLQVMVHQFVGSAEAVNVISGMIFLVLFSAAAVPIWRKIDTSTEWLGLAVIAVLTLMPVYQRFYSATVFAFTAYWAIDNWSEEIARALRLVLLTLLVPLVTLTKDFRPVVSFIDTHHLSSNRLWNGLVMSYTVWIELAVAVLLIVQLWRMPARNESRD